MSQRPDPNFIPKQETRPAGGFNHTKVCSSRLEIGTFLRISGCWSQHLWQMTGKPQSIANILFPFIVQLICNRFLLRYKQYFFISDLSTRKGKPRPKGLANFPWSFGRYLLWFLPIGSWKQEESRTKIVRAWGTLHSRFALAKWGRSRIHYEGKETAKTRGNHHVGGSGMAGWKVSIL